MKDLFQILSCVETNGVQKCVNEHLKELCRKNNFSVIDNCKFIIMRHFNKSGIHLKGSIVLGECFVKYVESLFN